MNKENKKTNSQLASVWRSLRRNRMAMLGLVILVLLALMAIFADFIAPYAYDAQDLLNARQAPSAEHIFGTDEFGRDIFSRIIYGSRLSLVVGFISVGIALVLGGFLGAVAGFYGGRLDDIIMRCMDILLAIPQVLLAIAIIASLGNGLVNLMVAVGIATIPSYARIVRASVMTIRGEEYIEAARASGTNDAKIIIKHILPNCLAPVIVQVTLGIANAILSCAALSFIGLGITPPSPEWGAMLSGARNYVLTYPYMSVFPGLAIIVTVLALNLLGDGLRDALDPKARR